MLMKNFWELVEKVIEESDVIIEVLDARMPDITRNKKAENLVKLAKKSLIFVLNKSDLIPEKLAKDYRDELRKISPCISVSTRERHGITLLKKKMFEMVKKRSRQEFVKVGVIGYPNTGKSSIVNSLAGRKKARVGSRAGQTKGLQWIRISSNMGLIDTPGIVPSTNEDDEVKHALIGALNPSKINDPEIVARKIVEMFVVVDKEHFENFYKINIGDKDFEEIISEIGKSRNMLKKGGVIDERRVYITMIHDWQKGRLLLKGT